MARSTSRNSNAGPDVQEPTADQEGTKVTTQNDTPQGQTEGTAQEAPEAVQDGQQAELASQGSETASLPPTGPADVDQGLEAVTGSTEPAPQANTPPPEGVPEPPPVIDRNTVTKQARTFIEDAAVVANYTIPPAQQHTLETRLVELFDEGSTDPADLAELMALELNMQPSWSQNPDQTQAMVISVGEVAEVQTPTQG